MSPLPDIEKLSPNTSFRRFVNDPRSDSPFPLKDYLDLPKNFKTLLSTTSRFLSAKRISLRFSDSFEEESLNPQVYPKDHIIRFPVHLHQTGIGPEWKTTIYTPFRLLLEHGFSEDFASGLLENDFAFHNGDKGKGIKYFEEIFGVTLTDLPEISGMQVEITGNTHKVRIPREFESPNPEDGHRNDIAFVRALIALASLEKDELSEVASHGVVAGDISRYSSIGIEKVSLALPPQFIPDIPLETFAPNTIYMIGLDKIQDKGLIRNPITPDKLNRPLPFGIFDLPINY